MVYSWPKQEMGLIPEMPEDNVRLFLNKSAIALNILFISPSYYVKFTFTKSNMFLFTEKSLIWSLQP